jgi:serine/threonine protein kinase
MSMQDRWQRVRVLFAKSLEQSDATRDTWLEHECGGDNEVLAEIRRLLAQRSNPASIFSDDAQALLGKLSLQAEAVDALLDTDIGPYRLRKLLGEGGMGRVYLAERTDDQFSQQVALKLIRSEFATKELHQRFLRERNTLARLAHPNIAQLHDGGVANDGAPYFTLEYIEGEPITRWCDARACDVRTRVSLMLKVCDAVLHAHRNLIVHRDLKPSNILVNADGEPKLLDFGIAKPLAEPIASETLTRADARPMTREYAAPEQLLGDPVTTTTDIYTLGVLLYLLLSGHMPYRRAELGETTWIKAILEDAPETMDRAIARGDTQTLASARSTTPVALARSLRGDLERIVQRALAKNAESRYPTVDRLADDLRAYLAGRAISGGTRTYRMRKFMRRHWLPLSAGALLFFIVLASAIGLAWEAAQVERQARSTAAVKDFLLDLFQKANPDVTNGKVPTMRDAVDLGAKRLESISSTEPELRAELQVTLGMIYHQLGMAQQAYDMHMAALTVLRQHSSDPELTVKAARFAAVEAGHLGNFAMAQTLADEALDRLHRIPGASAQALITTLDVVNYVAVHRSDLATQKRVTDEAMKAIEGQNLPDDVLGTAFAMRADYARLSHDDATATDYYKRLWKLDVSPQIRTNTGMTLGISLQNQGHYEEAATYLNQTWQTSKQAFGDSHTRTLRIGQVLSFNESYEGHIRQAYEHMAQLLRDSHQASPPHEDVIAEIEINCGDMLLMLEEYAPALEHVKAAKAYSDKHPEGETRFRVEVFASMGNVYLYTGKLDDAQKMFEESLRFAAEKKVPEIAGTEAHLAFIEAERNDVDAALRMAAKSRADLLQADGENSFDAVDIHYFSGRVFELAERPREAEAEYRASIKSQIALTPPDGMHFASADDRFALGKLLARNPATREEGRTLLGQAAALREETLGAGNAHTQEAKQERDKLASVQ